MIGARGGALRWVESHISARTQVIRIGDATSQPIHLPCVVPQGSVLGPLLFNTYCHVLGSVFVKHGVHYHMYADYTQLYVDVPRDQPERATESLSCVLKEVKEWMPLNKLTLNCSKTDVIAITTATRRDLRPIVVHVDTEAFRPKPYVRDIGIAMDDTMNMDRHVRHTCRLAYHHLRSIATVRNSLTTTTCKTLVLSLVISRLDFGNTTLYGISETLLHGLQVVQNSAARLIMRVRQREHITPILFALHWLPVRQRIQFKILTLVYRFQNHQAPAYLSTCITPYAPGRSLRSKINDPTDEKTALTRIQACVRELKAWLNHNRLHLNDNKTEVLVITTQSCANKHSVADVIVGDSIIRPTAVARNIGVMFDNELSLKSQVSKLCQVAFFYIRRIRAIRDCLTQQATELLIHSLVISRLDYGNGLLYGVPDKLLDKLQRVQNVAARVVVKASRYDHITPILKSLHWLPIRYRTEYKLLLLTFKALHHLAPSYLTDLLQLYHPTRTLRSSSDSLLTARCARLRNYGDRAFCVAAPKLWNDLPLNIRECGSVHSFKRLLKTYFFKRAFNI